MKKAIKITTNMLLICILSSCTNRDFYNLIVNENSEILIVRSDNDKKVGPLKIHEKIHKGNYKLGSDDDKKGIYKIDFLDTTLTPGRIILSIENTKIDIMEKAVFINQQEHKWK